MTGHRPNKIGGYNPMNPVRVKLRQLMREKLEQLAPEKVYSGMALGIDQDFVSVCLDLKIPFVAAVPFRGQESQWPEESQRLYYSLLDKAVEVIAVSEPGYAAWKMQERNEWMVDQVGADGVVLAIWDGSSGGTGNCTRYAKRLDRKIVRINPDEVALSL